MATVRSSPGREYRRRILKEIVDKVERGTPTQVIIRFIVNQTPYTLTTAYRMLAEAKYKADPEMDRLQQSLGV